MPIFEVSQTTWKFMYSMDVHLCGIPKTCGQKCSFMVNKPYFLLVHYAPGCMALQSVFPEVKLKR